MCHWNWRLSTRSSRNGNGNAKAQTTIRNGVGKMRKISIERPWQLDIFNVNFTFAKRNIKGFRFSLNKMKNIWLELFVSEFVVVFGYLNRNVKSTEWNVYHAAKDIWTCRTISNEQVESVCLSNTMYAQCVEVLYYRLQNKLWPNACCLCAALYAKYHMRNLCIVFLFCLNVCIYHGQIYIVWAIHSFKQNKL